ncbi:MAG: hypothetical protein EOP06_01700 [Proteobacteria bacterium]|nr:MAG: hypothetical protein EOP06_01700 [Pseudomonadota bacterium]
MKKALLVLILPLASTLCGAQSVSASDVSAATRKYRVYRLVMTEPSFGLARVKAIIKQIKPKEQGDGELAATAAWAKMSTSERFTYSMIHGEVSTQVCDSPPWVTGEETKIFGALTAYFSEQNWSDRQRAFLKANRREVVRLMRSTIGSHRRVGVNLKDAIVNLGLYELIPDISKVYLRDRKDNDLLTVMLILMKDGKDAAFAKTITYQKLYGPDANFTSYIDANRANQDLVVKRAMAYYHRKVG